MTPAYKRVTCRAPTGHSLIELALILPVLLILVLGVIDFGRALHYYNILINISREGANLASRTSETRPYIITALVKTAEPLQMQQSGMIYITRLSGRADGSAQVEEQYRATTGQSALTSKIWSGCTSWQADGTCNVPTQHPSANLSMTLRSGEVVHTVEALYDYNAITTYVMKVPPDLYSWTVL